MKKVMIHIAASKTNASRQLTLAHNNLYGYTLNNLYVVVPKWKLDKGPTKRSE